MRFSFGNDEQLISWARLIQFDFFLSLFGLKVEMYTLWKCFFQTRNDAIFFTSFPPPILHKQRSYHIRKYCCVHLVFGTTYTQHTLITLHFSPSSCTARKRIRIVCEAEREKERKSKMMNTSPGTKLINTFSLLIWCKTNSVWLNSLHDFMCTCVVRTHQWRNRFINQLNHDF